ncbi:MAG: SDR family oxidoreductase [Dehalococcoidia bacterium]|nr:SDR family oxidoreductase [Dehalococcoidia bacterium]
MTAKAFELKGKTALVTGDSKFWLKPIVTALAEAGADIAVAAGQTHKLEDAVEIAKSTGRKALAVPTDITSGAQVKKAVDRVIGEFGRIDILVNASDVNLFQPFCDIKDTEWDRVMDYNFNSAMHFCRAAGRQMVIQKKGRIINVISGLAERGHANGTAYCVSMGAVLQLTKALALEWALTGVTVNAIGTGWFTENGSAADEAIARYIPAKRYGKPYEIGSLVVYLASDVTDFTTGQFMYVDGGLMAHA